MLKVESLTKAYDEKIVVNNLSLKVKKGTIYGLIGPNGAGKTTTIECILGLKKFNKGQVSLNDQSVQSMKHKIGVQFQTDYFPEKIKVIEMIEMMAVLYDECEDDEKLLKIFNLKKLKFQYVSKLSGGERQRLSIMLALINKPEIVFLDELTTGLDPEGRREIWELLKTLNKEGMTIFLTSHFMDEVEYLCDEIHMINHGKTVFQGTINEFLSYSRVDELEHAYLKQVKGEIDEEVS